MWNSMKRRRGAVPVGGGQGVFEADSGEAPRRKSRRTSGGSRHLDSILSKKFHVGLCIPLAAYLLTKGGTCPTATLPFAFGHMRSRSSFVMGTPSPSPVTSCRRRDPSACFTIWRNLPNVLYAMSGKTGSVCCFLPARSR